MYGPELMSFNPDKSCNIQTEYTPQDVMKKVSQCGIILFNKDMKEVLLVYQTASQKWGFPKGHMTQEETYNKAYYNCAKRELFEETGINLRNLKHSKYGSIIIDTRLFFVIEVKQELVDTYPLDLNEIEKIQWVKKNDLNTFIKTHDCNVTLNKLF